VNQTDFVATVELLRRKPRNELWQVLKHLNVHVREWDRDGTDRHVANVFSVGTFVERVTADDIEHLLAKAVTLALSERLDRIASLQRDIVQTRELLHEPRLIGAMASERVFEGPEDPAVTVTEHE